MQVVQVDNITFSIDFYCVDTSTLFRHDYSCGFEWLSFAASKQKNLKWPQKCVGFQIDVLNTVTQKM
jgi:hypothetical protein